MNWHEKDLLIRNVVLYVRSTGRVGDIVGLHKWAPSRGRLFNIGHLREELRQDHFKIKEKAPDTTALIFCSYEARKILHTIVGDSICRYQCCDSFIRLCEKPD